MPIYKPDGNHNYYTDSNRHFAPRSESYTGADSLVTAQREGWSLVNIAYEKVITLHSGCHTNLYYFKLVRGSEKMVMPIIANPFIERMLLQLKMLVLPYPNESSEKPQKQISIEAQPLHAHELSK